MRLMEGSAMPECQCGAHVSETFARVLGDNDGAVHACFECCEQSHLKYRANGRERPHMGSSA
jgi:hypothetical protein